MKIGKTQTRIELSWDDIEDAICEYVCSRVQGANKNSKIDITITNDESEKPEVSVEIEHDLSKQTNIRTPQPPQPSFPGSQKLRAMNTQTPVEQLKKDADGYPVSDYTDNLYVDDILASKVAAAEE